MRDVGGREPVRPEIDELYDAFEHPRGDRPDAAAARARPRPAPTWRRSATRCSTCSTAAPLRRAGRWSSDGFAFGMIVQHEQQHDETMLATHQLRAGRRRCSTRRRRPPATARRRRPRCWSPPGRSRWAPPPSRGRWTTSGPRTASTCPRSSSTPPRSPTAQYAAFIDAGGYDDPRWWSRAGWAHRQRGRARPRPLFWRRDGDGWWHRRFGVRRAGARRRAGGARVLLRGRGVRRAGRASGCPPRRSGRRRPAATRPPAARAATRGATTTRPPRTPTSGSATCARRRSAPTRPAPRRWACSS